MSFRDDCARVYAPRSRRAHLLAPGESPSDCPAALCRLRLRPAASWLGTGTQDEHDRAVSLPLCRRCGQQAPPPVPGQSGQASPPARETGK